MASGDPQPLLLFSLLPYCPEQRDGKNNSKTGVLCKPLIKLGLGNLKEGVGENVRDISYM